MVLQKLIIMSKLQFCIAALALLVTFINPWCGNSVTVSGSGGSGGGDDVDGGVHIGVVVDKKSSVSKIVLRCINMAVSDIRAQNGTQIVLHIRDTKGDSLIAITSSLDLLNNSKVQAMIIPELGIEASVVAALAHNAQVPILSFTSLPSVSEHSYYLQIKEDETAQFDAIIALLEKFNWRNVVLIYEETDGGRNSLKDIVDKLQEKTNRVVYKSFNPLVADDGMIIDGLAKLKSMQTSVFIVHASKNLASKVFLNARRLSMIDRGYAWLVTSKMMDFFDSLDPSAMDSMQGALGLKLYIPASNELQDFTIRWKREAQYADLDLESMELKIFGIKAYDTIWALTEVIASIHNFSDSVGATIPSNGSEVLAKLLKSEFSGLGGDYQFINGTLKLKGYEVVNIKGKKGDIVGYWTPVDGLSQGLSLSNDSVGTLDLKNVSWPGQSTTIPKNWLFHESGRRIQIAHPMKDGFSELVQPPTETTKVSGFVVEVFEAAVEWLEFDVPYEFIPYKSVSGGYQMNYDEIVESVYHKRFDAAIGDITITANRSLYVDFTIPYTELALGTIVKLDMQNRWFFLRPFDSNLWIAGGIFSILLGGVVWIIESPTNKEFQGSVIQQIGTILWFSICTLVFAQGAYLKSNLSRFVVGIWFFVVFILTASYTAILSSILTVQQIQATGGDNIGYYGSSVRDNVVKNFYFNETDNRLDNRLRHLDSPKQYAEALSRNDGHGVGAIIDEMPYIRIFLAQYTSDYALIETTDTSNGFGFFFQKGSPLVPELSRAIEHLREIGKLQELEQKWYNRVNRESPLSTQQNDQTGPKTLSLSNFRGLFFISGISKTIVLGIVLFLFLRKRIPLKLSEFLLKIQLAVTRECFAFRVGHANEVAAQPRVNDI